MIEWISVKKELPWVNRDVLAWRQRGTCWGPEVLCVDRRDHWGRIVWRGCDLFFTVDVTHWAELPEGPSEADDE